MCRWTVNKIISVHIEVPNQFTYICLIMLYYIFIKYLFSSFFKTWSKCFAYHPASVFCLKSTIRCWLLRSTFPSVSVFILLQWSVSIQPWFASASATEESVCRTRDRQWWTTAPSTRKFWCKRPATYFRQFLFVSAFKIYLLSFLNFYINVCEPLSRNFIFQE